ncbi:hypothetical protein WMY93_009354 [Mugilogobius chulae]|uniref:Serine protease n=1 Tax=Mugilogobius chulae TaxID=88201 RepID=A0AAW0PGF7_9GOBI
MPQHDRSLQMLLYLLHLFLSQALSILLTAPTSPRWCPIPPPRSPAPISAPKPSWTSPLTATPAASTPMRGRLDVEDEDFVPPLNRPRRRRIRRQIYGADGRFNIKGDNFLLDYPFSTAVRISTGCTGVLVSQLHVLTAAHCVHDGKDYVKGARKLKVGFLINPVVNNTNSEMSSPKKPLVRWVRVRRTRVPKGWIQGPQEVSMDFDYALLELRWPHRRPFMRLSVAPSSDDLAGKRIHFSGFDSDRPGELVYRFCPVEEESKDLIYQHCDARPGASGSGVYGRVWDDTLEKWERKVIGIFSGHQWLEIDGENRDYNVAVRITPLKFAQICYWVHGNRLDCVHG